MFEKVILKKSEKCCSLFLIATRLKANAKNQLIINIMHQNMFLTVI